MYNSFIILFFNKKINDNHGDNKNQVEDNLLFIHSYEGFIFFVMISILFFRSSFTCISSLILSIPWITVVWSFLPSAFPIFWRDSSVSFLQRYIQICLGSTNSELRRFDVISSAVIPKCSATILIMRFGVICLDTFGEIISFNASFTLSSVISTLFNLEKAIILL